MAGEDGEGYHWLKQSTYINTMIISPKNTTIALLR